MTGLSSIRKITEDLIYLGTDDRRTALFENVYPIQRGVSYNSYLLLDEKTVLFDTAARDFSEQFFLNLNKALDGRDLDYLVVHHMEPDHSSAVAEVIRQHPGVCVVCTAAAAKMIKQFHGTDVTQTAFIAAEGKTIGTGKHTLVFTMAPMVHWPEVMMTYDQTERILFSADAFGTFGALSGNLFADEVRFESDWADDARRYYCNIVGKYGTQVQNVLKKAAKLDIDMICPLHGPVWRRDIGWFIDKYDKWSSYVPEDRTVLIVYGSVYGDTEGAANRLASLLSQRGITNVRTLDVSKTHVSELIAESFRVSHIVLASITYNMGIFTPMKNYLADLKAHNLSNRKYALIENGSWAPASGKLMDQMMAEMNGMVRLGETVTIRSAPDKAVCDALTEMADIIAKDIKGEE